MPLAPVTALLALALGPGPPPANDPIVGGTLDSADHYPSVVALQAHDKRCSGILVAPTTVLTAAHCVTELRPGRTAAAYPGSTVDPTMLIQGIDWGAHPDYCPDCDDAAFDFGFVELLSPLEPAGGFIPPVTTQAEWDAVMQPDATIIAVGYGGLTDEVENPSQRHVAELTVTKVLRSGVEFRAGGDGTGPCDGDSGSPAFLRLSDGSLRIAGIDSSGFGCGEPSIYGAPLPALCWLRDETDVDLLPPGCESCDCVDTSRGCSCSSSHPTTTWWWLPALLVLAHRRRPPVPD